MEQHNIIGIVPNGRGTKILDKSYELIKTYPSSPVIGTKAQLVMSDTHFIADTYWHPTEVKGYSTYYPANIIENSPEYWKRLT